MIQNARILSTFLGTEDHGILTATLILQGDGWGTGFGGWGLDAPENDSAGKFLGRRGTAFGMEWIRRLLATLELQSWEKLPGTLVRVETDGPHGKVFRIGHAIKDRWFSSEDGGGS